MQKEKNGDDENGDDENAVKVEVTIPRNREYDEGPPPSRTHDDTSHHSSPQPSDVQQHPFQAPKVGGKSGQREITGGTPRRVEVPMHVTKHPEPKGRPKQTEGSDRQSTRDEGDYD